MNIAQQISNPIFASFTGCLVLLLGICLGLFLSLKRQTHHATDQSVYRFPIPEQLSDINTHLENFKNRMEELERRRPSAPVQPRQGSTAKVNQRRQMMELHRSGQPTVAIASALGVSQGEVKLTLKLQEILAEPALEDSYEFI